MAAAEELANLRRSDGLNHSQRYETLKTGIGSKGYPVVRPRENARRVNERPQLLADLTMVERIGGCLWQCNTVATANATSILRLRCALPPSEIHCRAIDAAARLPRSQDIWAAVL
jgi:hypothetical protein